MSKPIDEQLYKKALAIITTAGQASISLLQRSLKIGYTAAASIINEMEETGIVGPYEGSKPRKVLIDKLPDSKPVKEPPKKPPKTEKPKKVQKPSITKKKPESRGRKTLWDTLEIESKLELIEAWARDGKTEEEIYKSLQVSKDTFYTWKKDKPEFSTALKSGKEITDYRVEKSLYKRAVGYAYTEETKESFRAKDIDGNFITYEDEDGHRRFKYEMVVTKTVRKEVAPDTAAAFIWLKNRKPEAWKDRHEDGPRGTAPPVFIDDIGGESE